MSMMVLTCRPAIVPTRHAIERYQVRGAPGLSIEDAEADLREEAARLHPDTVWVSLELRGVAVRLIVRGGVISTVE